MTGDELYEYLRKFYVRDGQALYRNYSFKQWLPKNNNSNSFQFNGNKPVKSIPKKWIVDAKNARVAGEEISRDWFNKFYNVKNYNDCRASVVIWLLENHGN